MPDGSRPSQERRTRADGGSLTSLPIRGITYDTGVDYDASSLSREHWHPTSVAQDMRTIARELHCTAVSVIGTDHDRLRDAAELALAEGLDVWLQPRLIEASWPDALEHLAVGAGIAERLREGSDRSVVLTLGCELSLFLKGILPGRGFMGRMRALTVTWIGMPLFDRRLNAYLRSAVEVARARFGGPVTYAAGEWEGVDWAGFDYVGVDLYREASNARSYLGKLRALHDHGKRVVITEFGCATFRGAERKGAGGFLIVDWRELPAVKPGYERDETSQADEIGDLVGLYREADIEGAFVYAFSEPRMVHTADPRTDLDMASFGVVKVVEAATAEAPERWEPKLAFDRLAEAYRQP